MRKLIVFFALFGMTWGALADCPKGYERYENLCADMQTGYVPPSVVGSTETMPEGGVKAAMPNSLAGDDANQDAEKAEATRQGRAAAGLPPEAGSQK